MSVYKQIETLLPELSKSERKIADHILKYPYDLQRFGGDGIASACDVSRSAVIRFCHKLGFTGYSDFRSAILSEPVPKQTPDQEAASNRVLDIYQNCIRQLDQNMNQADIDTISDLILHARRTVTFGVLHSSMSAMQFSFRLNRQGIDSHPVSDQTVMDNYSEIMNQGDVAVIFSLSGQKIYLDYILRMRQKRVSVILITMNPNTPLARYVDHMLVCPTAIYSSSSYLLDDAIIFFLMIEVLIEAIVKKINANNQLNGDSQ